MTHAALTLGLTKTAKVDNILIRYADTGARQGPTLLMTSPWPESLLAFRHIWSDLAPLARLVAVDLPGFGHSEGRTDLLSASEMARFLRKFITALKLCTPHLLAPNVGTGAALFLSAYSPRSVASVIVGGGAVAYPLKVAGSLADLIAAPDLERLRDLDIRASVGSTIEAVAPHALEPEVWEDCVTSYENGRFAESARYVRQYPRDLGYLAGMLSFIPVPILILNAEHDDLVPPSNGVFLHDRLPHSRLTHLDTDRYGWEQQPAEYAQAIADWITNRHRTV